MTTSTLAHVTDATFDTLVAPGTGLVAVKFTAEWCGPCRMMAPIVESVARDYADALTVLELDYDANPRAGVRFGVRGIPTILLFRDGELVDRVVGAMPRQALRERLDRAVTAA